MERQVARTQDIDDFLSTTMFTGYQSVPLPDGREVPGRDRSHTVQAVFSLDVAGKSVLDVGCHYGLLSLEAVRRGARRSVGLEADAERYGVARTIAALYDGLYEVRCGRVEDLPDHERFDVVMLLNVMHHLKDPISVLRRLASLCDDTVVVEFPTPGDRAVLAWSFSRGRPTNRWQRWLARACSVVYRRVGEGLPLMAVGSREYHQTFYFTPAAFRNLFVVHLEVFNEVTFTRSSGGRYIAFCSVARPTTTALA